MRSAQTSISLWAFVSITISWKSIPTVSRHCWAVAELGCTLPSALAVTGTALTKIGSGGPLSHSLASHGGGVSLIA